MDSDDGNIDCDVKQLLSSLVDELSQDVDETVMLLEDSAVDTCSVSSDGRLDSAPVLPVLMNEEDELDIKWKSHNKTVRNVSFEVGDRIEALLDGRYYRTTLTSINMLDFNDGVGPVTTYYGQWKRDAPESFPLREHEIRLLPATRIPMQKSRVRSARSRLIHDKSQHLKEDDVVFTIDGERRVVKINDIRFKRITDTAGCSFSYYKLNKLPDRVGTGPTAASKAAVRRALKCDKPPKTPKASKRKLDSSAITPFQSADKTAIKENRKRSKLKPPMIAMASDVSGVKSSSAGGAAASPSAGGAAASSSAGGAAASPSAGGAAASPSAGGAADQQSPLAATTHQSQQQIVMSSAASATSSSASGAVSEQSLRVHTTHRSKQQVVLAECDRHKQQCCRADETIRQLEERLQQYSSNNTDLRLDIVRLESEIKVSSEISARLVSELNSKLELAKIQSGMTQREMDVVISKHNVDLSQLRWQHQVDYQKQQLSIEEEQKSTLEQLQADILSEKQRCFELVREKFAQSANYEVKCADNRAEISRLTESLRMANEVRLLCANCSDKLPVAKYPLPTQHVQVVIGDQGAMNETHQSDVVDVVGGLEDIGSFLARQRTQPTENELLQKLGIAKQRDVTDADVDALFQPSPTKENAIEEAKSATPVPVPPPRTLVRRSKLAPPATMKCSNPTDAAINSQVCEAPYKPVSSRSETDTHGSQLNQFSKDATRQQATTEQQQLMDNSLSGVVVNSSTLPPDNEDEIWPLGRLRVKAGLRYEKFGRHGSSKKTATTTIRRTKKKPDMEEQGRTPLKLTLPRFPLQRKTSSFHNTDVPDKPRRRTPEGAVGNWCVSNKEQPNMKTRVSFDKYIEISFDGEVAVTGEAVRQANTFLPERSNEIVHESLLAAAVTGYLKAFVYSVIGVNKKLRLGQIFSDGKFTVIRNGLALQIIESQPEPYRAAGLQLMSDMGLKTYTDHTMISRVLNRFFQQQQSASAANQRRLNVLKEQSEAPLNVI